MTKNTLYKAVLIFNLMFILPGIGVVVLLLVNPAATTLVQLGCIAALLALLAALFYTIKGFSKKQAWAHKLFLVFFLLAVLLTQVGARAWSDTFTVIMTTITAVLLLLLLFGKNLGFHRSLIFCVILGIIGVLLILRLILTNPDIGRYGDSQSNLLLIWAIADTALSVLLGTLTFSKYIDKVDRGRAT